ncbi:MAG: MFS transporter permease [Xanthomonadales bacterium]|nr:MFS transporter permease [Xanthomonadales bacterium]
MTDWLDYAITDFVPFSAEAYWRLIENHNRAVWPLHLAAVALGAAAIFLTVRPFPWSGRAVACLLAVAWAWVGWRFVGTEYAALNWAGQAFMWAFMVQAALLLVLGAIGERLGLGASRKGWQIDLGLAVAALALYPMVPMVTGRPMAGAEVFGIAPDPTALATLGFVALAPNGVTALVLSVIPLAWIAVSAVTLSALGALEAWVLIAAGVMALGGLLLRRPVLG